MRVGNGRLSMNELARCLERHYKNLQSDAARVIELGLIEREWPVSSAVRCAARVINLGLIDRG